MSTGPAGNRFRLLVLAPFPPRLNASHGGGRVLAQYLANACSRYQVALLYLRAPGEAPIDRFFSEHCDRVEEVLRPWAGRSFLWQAWRLGRLTAAILQRQPMWVKDWQSREFAERVKALTKSWNPQLIQFELHIMAQYIPSVEGSPAPRVLVEYEPGVLAAPYLKAGPAGLSRLVHKLDRLAWIRYETAILSRVQAVVAFTEKDRQALTSYGVPTPIHLIPFGTEISETPLNPLGNSPAGLLFTGNFLHPPNREAALRLARDIFPRLKMEFPELTLTIVGPDPSPALKACEDESLHVTGWVPDPQAFLDRAAVFVAPLRSGGGMRVKMLEALSAGKAIVATPLAVEGLDVKDGVEVLLAESDEEISDRIRKLLIDPEMRTDLARRARAWACAHLGWDQAIAAYDQLYRALLEKFPPA